MGILLPLKFFVLPLFFFQVVHPYLKLGMPLWKEPPMKRRTRLLYYFVFFIKIFIANYEKMSVLLEVIFFLCFMFFLMKLSYITCSICKKSGNVLYPVCTFSVWQCFWNYNRCLQRTQSVRGCSTFIVLYHQLYRHSKKIFINSETF